MKLKRLLVGALSAAMIFSSVSFAFAADDKTGQLGGQGTVEGAVQTDFFKVQLPTVADTDTTYDFILDPQQLIKATNAANYEGLTKANFEDGATMFFKNSETKYSSTSNGLTATNLGSVDADITVEATLSDTVSGAEAIKFTEDKTFKDDTDTSVYLAMTEVSTGEAEPAVKAVTTKDNVTKATLNGKIDKNPSSSFEKALDSGEYVYKLKSDAPKDKTYSFALTGKCNPAGDWTKAKALQPTVLVTWEVAEASKDKAPSTEKKTYKMNAGTALPIKVDLGTGDAAATTVKEIKHFDASGTEIVLPAAAYTYADKTITITSARIDAFFTFLNGIGSDATKKLIVVFDDKASTRAEVTLTR